MSQHDDRLTRLEHYLGGPLHAGKPTHRKIARTPSSGGSARRATLAEAVPGYAVRVPERGNAYKVLTPMQGKDGALLQESFAAAFSSQETPIQQRLQARCGVTALPDDVLFFDLETTGLGQTPLFLIGAMTWEADQLVVRQFLARDYGEEAAIIQLFLELAATKRLLISFNGKSFDLPFLRQRAETHNMPSVLHIYHFDLLHECRRVWGTSLPNCQLQTLEQHVCGHPPRSEDIPSELIPATYETFRCNGNALPLAQIMRHNVRDLVTMAELLTKLPPLEEA